MATNKDELQARHDDERHETEAHGHAHASDAHGHADEAEVDAADEARSNDPLWWTPHLVLIALLCFGLGSMMGLFNKWLVPLVHGQGAAHAATAHGSADHGAAHAPAKPAAAKPAH